MSLVAVWLCLQALWLPSLSVEAFSAVPSLSTSSSAATYAGQHAAQHGVSLSRLHMLDSSYLNSLSQENTAQKEEDVVAEAVGEDDDAAVVSEAAVDDAASTFFAKEVSSPAPAPAPAKELTEDARIALTVSSALTTLTGPSPRRGYEVAREALRDFRARTNKRLSRSAFEKEKAEEKIRKIQAKAAEEIRVVEAEWKEKVEEAQARFSEETESVRNLLDKEIGREEAREGRMLDVISSLDASMETKSADVAKEEGITTEMQEVRSKLKAGAIASQLDEVIAQKMEVASIETSVVRDMTSCLSELEALLADSRQRTAVMKEIQSRIQHPSAEEATMDWADMDTLERTLEMAAATALESDKRVSELKQRMDAGIAQKVAIMGGGDDDDESGPAVAAPANGSRVQKPAPPKVAFDELKSKEDSELVRVLASSMGGAAVRGSKAAVFGLKAVLDTVTGRQVVEATNEALEISGKSMVKVTESITEGTDPVATGVLQDTVKSTGEALGAMGKAGRLVASNVSKAPTAKNAREAIAETSQDLVSAVSALAALGLKRVKDVKLPGGGSDRE